MLVVVLSLLGFAGPASAQQPLLMPATTVDGPSSSITRLTGAAVSRDGSGGLVYLRMIGGTAHVFASVLTSGAFGAPQQVDAGLGGASSQPVIAAGDGGLLLVAFINNGSLWVVQKPSSDAGFGAPQLLASPAASPAISMSIHSKAYLAFTGGNAGAHDVQVAYYVNGAWSLIGSPLDAAPGNDAGDGSGRPAVTAAGDGVGIVAWGESGHIYVRRVWATAPSVVFEQADVPSYGAGIEVLADEPAISGGDDSSYAVAAWHEVFAVGATHQDRVLSRRLQAGIFNAPVAADGLGSGIAAPTGTASTGGAVQPQVAMSQYMNGFVSSGRTDSDVLYATTYGNNGALPLAGAAFDSPPLGGLPFAVPAVTGLYSGLLAWQQTPPSGSAGIDAQFYDGTNWGPVLTPSNSSLGPAEAGSGLAADGDRYGDVAIAWIQGVGSAGRVEVAQLFYPPGAFSPVSAPLYSRTSQPTFSWNPSTEAWGGPLYTVVVDGVLVGSTEATSLRVPAPIADGPHTWQVTAVNTAGETATAKPVRVWIDTVAPTLQFTLTGAERAGARLRLRVRASDSPPPEPAGAASGIATVNVSWGDRASATISTTAVHVYSRPGRYRLTVTVTDRAGNSTKLVRRIRIAAALRSRR
jgi:hypothetical protein